MSTYIALGKAPESPEERAALLAKKVEMEEYMAGLQLTQAQKRMVDFLVSRKGYSENELEINQDFTFELPGCSFVVRADIIVKIKGKRLFTVKCAMSSMESWERHAVAFGRVADVYQIPYAVITDSEDARIIATADGTLVAQGLDAVPSRQEAERLQGETTFNTFPPERLEKEKRSCMPLKPSNAPIRQKMMMDNRMWMWEKKFFCGLRPVAHSLLPMACFFQELL